MIITAKISKIIASIGLILALSSPSGIQLLHAFNKHEHRVCYDFQTHIHEQKIDCSIFNFHLSNFSYQPFDFHLAEKIENSLSVNQLTLQIEYPKVFKYKLLRAPPKLV